MTKYRVDIGYYIRAYKHSIFESTSDEEATKRAKIIGCEVMDEGHIAPDFIDYAPIDGNIIQIDRFNNNNERYIVSHDSIDFPNLERINQDVLKLALRTFYAISARDDIMNDELGIMIVETMDKIEAFGIKVP